MWGWGSDSERDPVAAAARDVTCLIAALPGLRRAVELAEREAWSSVTSQAPAGPSTCECAVASARGRHQSGRCRTNTHDAERPVA